MLASKFLRSRNGNFSLLFGIALPAILASVGFAVDVSSLMRAKVNLQNSLDGSILASSHLSDSEADRQTALQRYFQANIANHTELLNPKVTFAVDKGLNYVKTKASASADVKLYFAFMFGDSKHVEVDAGAMEATNNLEVVLVLDNTGSMAGAKIKALRDATKALLDDLGDAKSPNRKVTAALVPFVTAVNVNGDEFDPSWIDMDGRSPNNGVNFPLLPDGKRANHMDLFKDLAEGTGWNGTGWKGCVEARPGINSTSDAKPDGYKPETLFVPYFAPDDPGDATDPSASYGNDTRVYNNSYLSDEVADGTDDKGKDKKVAKYKNPKAKKINDKKGPLTVGPNRACPTPVVPLTGDLDKLRTAAAQMQEWNGSGTNVSEGLSWGMRVLSPDPPYTDGAAWKAPNTSKIVVLLTDGENVVFGASNEPEKSDYTSYGYLGSGRFGTTNQTDAAREVDRWTLDVCQKLKAQQVQIYTITLQSDTAANRTLYGKCATNPTDYYAVNDPSKLPNVFKEIAGRFTELQLVD
ncbi:MULTISPECIES: pilus assembly protein [unclassified Mesorhizobium]|uniref:pilus assembly protein n=1 Tax=unclassified Mesorhizobium TaxID=325217 RepID=UPI001CCFDFAD|nr:MULTISPECIES: pilus assembly protein [unclassified Mesorhizobium]MBZ9739695.1 pilus assembly protein [Mesorhizobium sp. CO1-1-4]MBZ9805041.1 pilus assembly protein [Mesorhizobium sp. ES1-6]